MNNSLVSQQCPPLMSDGRHATDYRPSPDVHDLIIKQNGIRNSHEFRTFLTKNSNEMRSMNSEYFQLRNQCNCPYTHVDPNSQNKYWDRYNQYIGYKTTN